MEAKQDISHIKNCTGCGACMLACHKRQAISLQPDAEGFFQPVIDRSKCNNCGLCYQRCHMCHEASAPHDESGFARKFYALTLKGDFPQVHGSTTTGAAYKISRAFLQQHPQGAVCGCIFDYADQQVKHVLVKDPDAVEQFCGSKYVQSNSGAAMLQVKQELQAGNPVLFIGMPCQVAGLKSQLTAKLRELLYTVDLICLGMTSPLVLKDYLAQNTAVTGKIKHINFRFRQDGYWKGEYHLKIVGEQNTLLLHNQDDPYLVAFLGCVNFHEPCYACPYKSPNLPRPADLTLGDFWGISNVVPECWHPELGVTQALVNTLRGEKLLQLLHYSIRDAYAVTEQQVKAVGPMLLKSAVRPAGRDVYYRVLNATHDPAQALQAARGAY